MTAEVKTNPPSATESLEVAWDEVAHAIFVQRGIDSGLWHLGLRIHFAALTTRSIDDPGIGLPTGVVSIANVTLSKAPAMGPMVFDAAAPFPKKKKKSVRRSLKHRREEV